MRTDSFAHRSSLRIRIAACLLTGVSLAVGASSILAQAQPAAKAQAPAQAAAAQAQPQYKYLTADPKLSKWSQIKTPSDERRVIENILKGAGSLDADQQKQFDAFFNRVVFPQFTLAENIFYTTSAKGTKNTVCMLPTMRKDFKQIFYAKEHTNRQARDRLNELTLRAMTAIANDNYHPIARYNAMLLIADLNEDEATDAPYKQALITMVNAARSSAAIDGVRVAALIGIVRHAKAGVDTNPDFQKALARILTQLATDKKRPADRSPEGHDWMRRRALEGLAALYKEPLYKEPPQDGSFLQLLAGLLQEKDSTLEFRAEAAKALLTVKIVAPPKFDSAKMAAGIGQIAVDAYHRELDTTDQFGRKISADGTKYYFALADKALAALNGAAPSPKIGELQVALADLVEKSTPEEPTELAQPDPLEHEKRYDKVAQSGAKLEALVTGRPESEILPKRAPVGGNAQAGGYSGYRGGYGGSRDSGGPRSPGPPGKAGYGRGGYGAGR